jgi:hypothetical protein
MQLQRFTGMAAAVPAAHILPPVVTAISVTESAASAARVGCYRWSLALLLLSMLAPLVCHADNFGHSFSLCRVPPCFVLNRNNVILKWPSCTAVLPQPQ